MAAAPAQPRRSRSRRRARTPLTGWQIATIIVMALLGLALVGSTIIPYLPGFF